MDFFSISNWLLELAPALGWFFILYILIAILVVALFCGAARIYCWNECRDCGPTFKFKLREMVYAFDGTVGEVVAMEYSPSGVSYLVSAGPDRPEVRYDESALAPLDA